MFEYFSRLLDNQTLSPHGICLLWRPELMWTHVISDALIGLAYLTIPLTLGVILRRRRDVPFGWLVWCFALFITACGLTHFMSIWTLWHPDYGAEALVKVVTAAASIGTAIALVYLIPLAVGVASPGQLRAVNIELEARIAERDRAIAALELEKAERQKAEDQLLQSSKMDALGQLTGGIAHDFNNWLQALQGSLELIQRRAADVVKVQQLAEGGLRATERGARLTAQLLAFSRSKQLALEPFYVVDMVSEMREMLARSLGPTTDLRFDLEAGEATVLADRTQLELAVLNLAINARDAMPEGGRIEISTRRVDLAEADPELAAGAYVEISVRDIGSGMTPEVRRRAFDPFYTTKGIGEGTGLGLSQVYGVAKHAGGTARIESAPGEGTTVSLLLPIVAQAAAEEPASASPARRRRPRRADLGAVMVVDDDDDVRGFMVDTLDDLGHTVTQAADGEAALAALGAAQPDVLVLDYAMPGMTGAEVAGKARALRPDVGVVFVTGYADPEALAEVLGPDEAVLRKPCRAEDLAEAVAAALTAARARRKRR
jgi:signal transduction histidine kinase/CheY-like chemotaxis protein